MDNMEYLNQISASNRPAKPAGSGLPFSLSPKLLIGGGIVIGLIFLIMVISAIFGSGGGSNTEQALVQKLNYRSENLSKTINDYSQNLKSSELRSMGSSLRTILNETSARTSTILEEDFDAKKADKTVEEDEDTYIEEINMNLENAKLNGLLDRTFVREMTYQIGILLSLESDIINKTSKSNLKDFLTSSRSNLEALHSDFNNYSGT